MMKSIEVYLKSVFNKLGVARQDEEYKQMLLCIGSIRGFIHALGHLGIITKVSEFKACSIPVDELSISSGCRQVLSVLREGYNDKNDGYFSRTEYVIMSSEGGEE